MEIESDGKCVIHKTFDNLSMQEKQEIEYVLQKDRKP